MSARLLVLIVLVVAVPIIAAGFLISVHMQQAMTEEKGNKLFGAARILDTELKESYNDILKRRGILTSDRARRIQVLNEELREQTDRIAAAYQGIGVGYYSKELDAILTYGPSKELGNMVGLSISDKHKGRLVMKTGEEIIQFGGLVRGDIMNAMHPIVRNGSIIGYIWANELMSTIDTQMGAIRSNIYIALMVGLFWGLLGATEVIDKFINNIHIIRRGILTLQNNLDYRLPELEDELGQIVVAVNQMANELVAKRQLENQVLETEHMAVVGEMAAGIAHEVRNPLMSIRGFAQLLKEEIAPNDRHCEYLRIIEQETGRMNNLIEQLLRFARPSAGRQNWLIVNKVLEDTIQLAETRIKKTGIQIRRELSEDLPVLYAGSEQLQQVLMNLLINAIQAVQESGNQGTITVRSAFDQENQQVQICVSDTGKGILPELMEKIFLPFFTTKKTGTGLGLAVVRRTMGLLGGTVMVSSEPEKGTTFTLILPVVREVV